MMRLSAVRSLLLDDIASLGPDRASAAEGLARLGRARLRAVLVALLDWVAIAVLFAWRGDRPFLALGATEEGVFTLGIVAVAIHSGYRLAQAQTLGAIRRALESLPAGGDESA